MDMQLFFCSTYNVFWYFSTMHLVYLYISLYCQFALHIPLTFLILIITPFGYRSVCSMRLNRFQKPSIYLLHACFYLLNYMVHVCVQCGLLQGELEKYCLYSFDNSSHFALDSWRQTFWLCHTNSMTGLRVSQGVPYCWMTRMRWN